MINEKILIIGSGEIAKRHAKILINEGILKKNIYFYKKKRKVKFKLFCKKKKIKKISKIEEIIKEKFLIIFICFPSTKHWYHFNIFKNSSENFFIEKPISHNLEDANKIIKYSKKKLIHIGYNLIFDEIFIYMKELIKRKQFGKILRIDCTTGQNLKFWRKNVKYFKTVSAKKKLGGGVLLELSHELNYLIWFFGKIKSIKADYFKLSNLKIDVEDYAFKQIQFKNKLIANINIDFFRIDKTRKIDFIFENGTVNLDYFNREILIYKKNKFIKKKFNKNFLKSYTNQIRYLFKSIKKKNNNYFKYLDISLDTIKIIDQIKNKRQK